MSQSQQRQSIKVKPPQTLAAFMKEKARKDCQVCQLPKEIRDQLGTEASKRGFSRQDQIEWLRAACGAAQVTSAILNRHLSSRHDEREEESNGAQ